MKAVVGIDLGRHWEKAVVLLRRLGFENLDPVTVNVVESVLPDGSFGDFGDSHPIEQMLKENEAEGLRMAEEAQGDLGGGTAQTVRGVPKEALLKVCDDVDAGLVVIGSEKKSALGNLFFGSVAKGLLTGSKCSVLFGKTRLANEGPLTAVFATDHSDYADRAAEWLMRAAPKGIGKLVVLTAVQVNPLVGKEIVQHVENVGDSVLASILASIRKKNEDLAQRLSDGGLTCVPEVREAYPSVAIEESIKEHGADLLIVGAQGRGFLERLRIGSTSFEQVVNTGYNVLVIRP